MTERLKKSTPSLTQDLDFVASTISICPKNISLQISLGSYTDSISFAAKIKKIPRIFMEHRHPHHHHKEEHLKSSAFISDVVIGMSDGLTVPFALAAGLSSAVNSNNLIITAGFAEIIAGSIAMGLGGFLAGQTAIHHYDSELKREYREIEEVPEVERREVKEVFEGMGLSEKVQEQAMLELCSNKENWVNFMMRYELGLERPDPKRARKSALNIGISYIIGGVIPLLSYFFTEDPDSGFRMSFVITVICLLVFGYFRGKVTGQHPVKGALKVTAIGVAAAMSAYFLTRYFMHL